MCKSTPANGKAIYVQVDVKHPTIRFAVDVSKRPA